MKRILLAFFFIQTLSAVQAQINPAGSYDSCGAAITLTVNASCTPSGQTYQTTNASKSPQTSPGFNSSDDDVWFKFTTLADQTHAKIQILNAVGGMGNCIELWSSCNASTHLEYSCGTELNSTSLTPSTTYLVRVYTNGTFATLSSFDMCVVNTTPPPPQPNSSCSFASNIVVSTNSLTCNLFPFSNAFATGSTSVAAPACLSSNYKDIWLKFTPSNIGLLSFRMQDYVAINGSSFPTYYVAVYEGTGGCASLNYIGCSSYIPTSGNDFQLPGTYNSGTTYYIRLLCDNSIEGSFQTCIKPSATTTSYPTAADSTCSRAIQIQSSANATAAYTSGSTNGIRVVSQLACYGYDAPNALAWYSFTVPTTALYFVDFNNFVRLTINANNAGFRILKRSSCYSTATDSIITKPPAGTYDTLICVDNISYNNQTIALTSGTQYYLTVMENSYNGGRVAYDVRVIGSTPAINDDSANAITLIQDVTCGSSTTATTLRFSTLSTTPNPFALSNSGTYTQDVWYKFVAATTTANINVTLNSGTTRLAVYNNNGTIKYDPGANASLITVNSLTIGNTYLIRVLNTNGTPVAANANFNICVFGTPSSSIAGTVATCTNSDAVLTSTNSGRWLHFTKAGLPTVSIFDGSAKPGFNFIPRGNISTTYFTNTGGVRLNIGTAYLDRNFEISDGGNNFSNSLVRVRFYFTIAEFNNLIASANNGGISAPNELKVYRIPGASCSNATTAGGLYYNIDSYGYLSDPSAPTVATGYYVYMITPNFSGFFLQQAAQNLLVPATCGSFSYKINQEKIQFSLSTLTEKNVLAYELQHSKNGVEFTSIETINAQNNNSNSYSFITRQSITNNAYYRVKQINKDGSNSFICNTLRITTKTSQHIFKAIYPNPVKHEIYLEKQQEYNGTIQITILNTAGKVFKQLSLYQTTNSIIKIPVHQLSNGMYYLRIIKKDGTVETKQFIKG